MAILSSVGSWELYPFRAYTATIAVASWAYVEIKYEGDGEVLENVGGHHGIESLGAAGKRCQRRRESC
jgi:hypothetical protein